MDKLIFFFLLVAVYHCSCEVVKFDRCTDNEHSNCTIQEVRINPCPQAEENKPCNIKRGKSAYIEFDFTPKANVNNLESRAYWATSHLDLPWVGMDTEACSYTTCPTEDHQQTYRYDLVIAKKFPARPFDVKWKLWKEGEMECCFITKIKLIK